MLAQGKSAGLITRRYVPPVLSSTTKSVSNIISIGPRIETETCYVSFFFLLANVAFFAHAVFTSQYDINSSK